MQSSASVREAIKFLTPNAGSALELRFRALLDFMAASEDVRHALRCQLALKGLTIEGFLALAAMRSAEPGAVTPSALARTVGTTRALLSHTLMRLEISNLISRDREVRDRRVDRRVVWVCLTPAGRTTIDDALKTCTGSIGRLVDEFDEKDLDGLIRACGKLNQSAHKLS